MGRFGYRLGAVLLAAAASVSAQAQTAPARVFSEGGNIFIERDGAKKQLTTSGRDTEPVLTPTGKSLVFTRMAQKPAQAADDPGDQDCDDPPKADELRQINVDGSGERVVVRGRKGTGPE